MSIRAIIIWTTRADKTVSKVADTIRPVRFADQKRELVDSFPNARVAACQRIAAFSRRNNAHVFSGRR